MSGKKSIATMRATKATSTPATELIIALEKAAGPDRELDAAILTLVGHQTHMRGAIWGWEYRKNGKGAWETMPSPTASIDAAMTLVPDNERVWLELNVYYPYTHPHAAWVGGDSSCRGRYSRSHTPAIALCIAALRAHNSESGE